jgi:hypothetical protein
MKMVKNEAFEQIDAPRGSEAGGCQPEYRCHVSTGSPLPLMLNSPFEENLGVLQESVSVSSTMLLFQDTLKDITRKDGNY